MQWTGSTAGAGASRTTWRSCAACRATALALGRLDNFSKWHGLHPQLLDCQHAWTCTRHTTVVYTSQHRREAVWPAALDKARWQGEPKEKD